MAEPTITMTGPGGGCIQIEGISYRPTATGVYTIPMRLEGLARSIGLKNRTVAGAPTVLDIPNGDFHAWKNTSDGTVKLYYNDAGVLKSVTLA